MPPSGSPELSPILGVVRYGEGGNIEALLAAFVAELIAAEISIGGLLQRSSREANGRPRMELIDIESGERLLISQNLGEDSRACCVDVGGVASAAMSLRRALDRAPSLLVINKFSGLEAKGGGLRAEFLDALASGIPVLTGLSARHEQAFTAMTGGIGQVIAPDLPALRRWWRSITAGSAPAPDRPAC